MFLLQLTGNIIRNGGQDGGRGGADAEAHKLQNKNCTLTKD